MTAKLVVAFCPRGKQRALLRSAVELVRDSDSVLADEGLEDAPTERGGYSANVYEMAYWIQGSSRSTP